MRLLLLFAILLLAVTTNAAPISGRVTDEYGNGVYHVTVTAQTITPCDDNFSAGFMTNPFGYYSGTFSPGGCNIVVTASYRGYSFAPTVYVKLFGEPWTDLDFVKQ